MGTCIYLLLYADYQVHYPGDELAAKAPPRETGELRNIRWLQGVSGWLSYERWLTSSKHADNVFILTFVPVIYLFLFGHGFTPTAVLCITIQAVVCPSTSPSLSLSPTYIPYVYIHIHI